MPRRRTSFRPLIVRVSHEANRLEQHVMARRTLPSRSPIHPAGHAFSSLSEWWFLEHAKLELEMIF